MYALRRPPILHAHLGAHKTASTYVQRRLDRGRTALENAGVHYWSPREARQGWTQRFRAHARTTNPARLRRQRRELRRDAPRCRLWLISEENLCGLPADLSRTPGLFPRAARNLRALQALYRPGTLRLFLAIRSYDEFFRSSYCECIRLYGHQPFAEFYNEAVFSRHSWRDLVAALADVVPEEHVTVWRYEDLRAVEDEVLQALTGGLGERDWFGPRDGKPARPSPSARAVEAMAELDPAVDRETRKAQVRALMERYPAGPNHSPLDPWNDAERRVLRTRYEDDCAAIRRDLPGVNWLSPGDGR